MPSTLDPGIVMRQAVTMSIVPGTTLHTNDIEASGTVSVNGSPVLTADSLAAAKQAAFAWGMAGAFVGVAVLAIARAVYRRAKMRAWLVRQPDASAGVYRTASKGPA